MTAALPGDESTDAALARFAPRQRRWSHRLPRFVRVPLMAVLFFFFFTGCPVIALVLIPLLRLFSKNPRRLTTTLLNRGLRFIIRVARFMGIVDFDDPRLPPEVDRSAPYVMISNHPTFVDMLLLLGSFDEMTCVTSGRWSRHWALGRLLRATSYLPGPGSGRPESENMLESMVAHLKAGHPLLIFPEGKRSEQEKLRRFRRGAVEAATRAGVPIVPLFLAIDRPYLTKEVPIWRPPSPSPVYSFEWFDVIDPAAFDGDARAIHRHVEALYKERFALQRAYQRSLSGHAAEAAPALPPDASGAKPPSP